MGAKFVAAIIGVIILVVLAQTFVFGGDDGAPSVNNPSSIPTATPAIDQEEPVLLGQSDAGDGNGGGGSSGGAQSTYTVQSGDTLGAIADQLGIAPEAQAAWVQEVLDLNGMEDARQLQAGQELILPGAPPSTTSSTDEDDEADEADAEDTPETESTAPPSATGTSVTPTPEGGGGAVGIYVVADGDYPYLIALKHCVDDPDAWVEELLDINGATAESLSIGQELDLPPGTPPFCGDEGTGEGDGEDDET
jgi:LysM repeat protein